MQTTVNGWSTTLQCGVPGNDILLQAARAEDLPAVNLPAEAVYWTTTVDGSDHPLNGKHHYVIHFPAGGLPPNDAFWSLTMTGTNRLMVANPIDRYSLGDRSGLAANPDGSIDITARPRPRLATSPIGCLRRRATSCCGCARISRLRPC